MKSIIALLLCAKQAFGSGWSYDSISDWSHDYPMCATTDQSPIDIQSSEAVIDPSVCTAKLEWDIDFTKQTFKIGNNGHSITLTPVEEYDEPVGEDEIKYITLDENENTIAKFPNYFAFTESNKQYCLAGLHFHWGTLDKTGSEHLVDGEQFPLEAHFVHYSCDHTSAGTVLGQFGEPSDVDDAEKEGIDSHQLGVVGILFDIVDDRINPFFEAMFDDNETVNNVMYPFNKTDPKVEEQFVYGLDLSQIIPDHVTTEGYYAYKGSLTTPPCTDIVNWHVMNARGYIGKSQIEKFRQLMSKENYAIAPNYRAVQDNVNTVYSCVDVDTITEVIYKDDGKETSWIVTAAVISFLVAAVLVGGISYFMYRTNKQKLLEQINAANKRSRLRSTSGVSDISNQYG
eukprot:42877_1